MLPSLAELRLEVGPAAGARVPLRPLLGAIGISPGRWHGSRPAPAMMLETTGAPAGSGSGRGKRAQATSDAGAQAAREEAAAKKAQRVKENEAKRREEAQAARTVEYINGKIASLEEEQAGLLWQQMSGNAPEDGRMKTLAQELQNLKAELKQKREERSAPTNVFTKSVIARELLGNLAAFRNAEDLAEPKRQNQELRERFADRIATLRVLSEKRVLYAIETLELAELRSANRRLRRAAVQGEKDFKARKKRAQQEKRRDLALGDSDNPEQYLNSAEDQKWWNDDGKRVWAARKKRAKTHAPAAPDRGEEQRAAPLDLPALDGRSDAEWLAELNAQLQRAGLEQVRKLSEEHRHGPAP
jgi:hypothetical protein